jgi:hypothetical protein
MEVSNVQQLFSTSAIIKRLDAHQIDVRDVKLFIIVLWRRNRVN